MAWGAAAAAVVGGIMGAMSASSDRAQQQAALEAGWAKLDQVGVPPDLSKRILLQQFQQVGLLTPELEQMTNILGESKVSMITEDSTLRNAQMDALRGLSQVSKEGMSAVGRLNLSDIRRDNAVESEAKRQQQLQSFAARGQGGSALEALSSQQASQAGAEEASRQGDREAAMASQNALSALSQAGQLGGTMRQTDFGIAEAKAGAADKFTFSRWNAENALQKANIAAMNQAQAYNLGNAQNISNMNTSQENTERQRMEQAKRDYWNDKLRLAGAYSGQSTEQAAQAGKNADRTANQWAGIGSGVATGIAGYNQYESANTQAQKNRENDLNIAKMKYS